MYKNIVVGTDGSRRADRAISDAAALARLSSAKLHIVQGCGHPVVMADAHAGLAVTHLQETIDLVSRGLEEVAAQIRESGIEVDVHATGSSGHSALCGVAEEVGADLIVVGNRGMTGASRFLGSVPNAVSHQAPCSVLILATD